MKRKYRLTKSSDIEQVRRKGKSFSHPLVVLITWKNDGEKVRIGVTAGRAVGGAVKRNRAKRMIRAGIQPLIDSISPGTDVVIIARNPISQAKNIKIKEVIRNLLDKAKVI